MHLAVNDYDGHRRLLYRTTTAGEAPSGVVQRAAPPAEASPKAEARRA
jgi:taurine dioxygenase